MTFADETKFLYRFHCKIQVKQVVLIMEINFK